MTERFQKVFELVCPKCHASIGGRCLDKVRDGSKYRSFPHNERIDAAQILITKQERIENDH